MERIRQRWMNTLSNVMVELLTSAEGSHESLSAVSAEPLVFLYFGNHWYAENRTSSHHIARELARSHTVHYFQCPGLRAPAASARDFKKVLAKVWGFLRGGRRVPEGITVYTLLQLPLHRFRLVRSFNRWLTRTTVRWTMWRHGIKKPIAWFHIPHVPFLIGSLGEETAVYYCIDDYAAFPGVNEEAVRRMDAETAGAADVVFVASDTLLADKKKLNDNVVVSPHGVGVEHFARAREPGLLPPTDIAHLPRPIVGFFGLIERFVDLELIDELAQRRPSWTFLLIGRVAVPTEAVPQRPNVHLIGPRPYEQLPAYGKCFDAAIIPYRSGNWSYHANPLKLREYLAMGKPIVSVDTPQVRKFADVVEIASDHEEFLAKLDKVLAADDSEAAARRRMDRVKGASWAARVREILHTLRGGG
jgi:glycosyltransferase involved in cell wall biosynthesis